MFKIRKNLFETNSSSTHSKDMKSKIKEYIFDNYILSSEDEEW